MPKEDKIFWRGGRVDAMFSGEGRTECAALACDLLS
jgi:hypothetical protein